jgi:hypothetical protein
MIFISKKLTRIIFYDSKKLKIFLVFLFLWTWSLTQYTYDE